MTLDGLRAYLAGKGGDSEAGQAARELLRERDALKEQVRKMLDERADLAQLRTDLATCRAHKAALTREVARLREPTLAAGPWEQAEF